MAGFMNFSPATAPIPDVPSPGQLTVSKTAENSKFQPFQLPDGNLGSRNFYASPLPVLWQLTASMGSRLYFLLAPRVKSLYNLVKWI